MTEPVSDVSCEFHDQDGKSVVTEPVSDVIYEFYNQTGKLVAIPITVENFYDTKKLYCVASIKDVTKEEDGSIPFVQYGYSRADYRNEDATSNTDIILEDPIDESDIEFMKEIALGRLQRRPTTVDTLDPTRLVLGTRLRKTPKPKKTPKWQPKPFSVTIVHTLLQESFQRTIIQRSRNGDVKRIICVVFDVCFCGHSESLRYGASINHADYGNKIPETEIDAEVVKLMATARVRYEKFPKIVVVPKFCKLDMDKYLGNTVRKLGCFQKPKIQKPACSEYVVWNK
jgi:hypothetical protein